MKTLLRPLSLLYGQASVLRNQLFDRGSLQVYKVPVPVMSIGNITLGGTGKTPITDFCLKELVRRGKKVAVISRSYRADVSSPCLVDTSHPFAARYFGDEPVLLAQENPQVSVFVGPKKWQTAKFAVSQDTFDLLIVDDGFQHRHLFRDLNIVILDATENLNNYKVFPEGRAREKWESLKRADLLILSKCNLVGEDKVRALEGLLPTEKEVLHFGYDIYRCVNVKTQSEISSADMADKKLFLVSAIARPEVFEKMMGEMGKVLPQSLRFRDHHQYTEEDIAKIENEFHKSGADLLVTTEKDAVKLRHFLKDSSILWSASLEVTEVDKKGRLHEIISQIFC